MIFFSFILYINNNYYNYYNYNYNKHYYFYYFFFLSFSFSTKLMTSAAHDIEELADPEYGAADEIDELTPIIFYLFYLNILY